MTPASRAVADDAPVPMSLVFLLAIGAGAAIASLYYSQPLLADIGARFHASVREAGSVTVAAQVGYAVGLLVLVPLGDVVERRGLIVACMLGSALSLLAASAAPSLTVLIVWSGLLGLVSVSPQLLVPYATTLASPERRGRMVGAVTAGLLGGIIAARFLGGVIGGGLGWRGLYACAAAGLVVVAFGLFRRLPRQRSLRPARLGELPGSLVALLVREPSLRRHMVMGAAGFAAFSVFWTTLSFYLAERSGESGAGTAGWFGLLGIVGVFAAPSAGRLADRLTARALNGVALLTVAFAFLPMSFAGRSLLWLAVGAVLLEAGVQCNLVSSQSRLHRLTPESRSRVNALYMAGYFAGGAAGSTLGPWCLTRIGWPGVCAVAAALALTGLLALSGTGVPGHSALSEPHAGDDVAVKNTIIQTT